MRKTLLCSFVLLMAYLPSVSQISIPASGAVSETFNGMASGTALPAHWKVSAPGTIADWTSAGNVTSVSQAANNGSPITAGSYNWGTATGSDRAVGFMTGDGAGGYSSPNAILAWFQNNTGSQITSLTVTFQIERYRVNQGGFFLAFFDSPNGSTWTARTTGDLTAAVYQTGNSAYTFSTPRTVYKTVTITGLSIASGGSYYLRWVFNNIGSANSQGLGLDNVTMSVNTTNPIVSATLVDAFPDPNTDGKAKEGDKITYTTTIKSQGQNGSGIQYNAILDPNTTATGSLRTSGVANDDDYSTALDANLTGQNVLSNDFGLPTKTLASFGATEEASVHSPGTSGLSDNGGALTVNADGTFSYAPPTGFVGYDRFAYVVEAGVSADDNSNVGIVTIAVGIAPSAGTAESFPGVIGNVRVANAQSLLLNDVGNDIAIAAVNGNAVSSFPFTSSTPHGSVTVNANGTFIYNPQAGYNNNDLDEIVGNGNDRFTYTIDNGFSLPQTVTVNISISGMIWFIANGGPAGNGTLASPFNSVAAFQAVNDGGGGGLHPAASEHIFIFEHATDYSGSITLLNGQRLIGQDATVSLTTLTGLTPPSYSDALPVTNSGNENKVNLTSSGDAITIATNATANLIRGLTIGTRPAANAAIKGNTFASLSISEVSINGTGQILSLTNGSVNGSFKELSTTSTTQTAIILSQMSGTLSDNNSFPSAISGANAGIGIFNGNSLSLTYNGDITHAGSNPLVQVLNHSSGTLLFQNGTLSNTSSNPGGLSFSNADGTYTFNSTTTLTNAARITIDAGADATNGSIGTFNFSTNISVTNPTNVALDINGSKATIDYNGTLSSSTAFRLIDIASNKGGTISLDGSVSGTGSNTGINLSTNTGTTINFTGLLTLNGTAAVFSATGGGTLTATNAGNSIGNTTAPTTSALTITGTTIGAGGVMFTKISCSGGVNGILLNGTGTGAFTVTGDAGSAINSSGGTISATTGAGISITSASNILLDQMTVQNGFDDGIMGSSVNNFSLTNSIVTNNGNALTEHGIDFTNVTGTVRFTVSTFSNNEHEQIHVMNDAVAPSTADYEFNDVAVSSTGLAAAPNGSHGINMTADNGANIDLRVLNTSTFDNFFSNSIQVQNEGSGTLEVTIANASFTNIGAGAINIAQNSTGPLRFYVHDNPTFLRGTNNAVAQSININQAGGATASSVLEGQISNNTIGDNTSSTSGTSSGSGIRIFSVGSGTTTVKINDNNLQGVAEGIRVSMGEDINPAHTINATIFNNTVSVTNSLNGFEGIAVNAGTSSNSSTTPDPGILRLDMYNNTASTNASGGNTDFLVRQRFGTTIQLLGYLGGNTDNAAVQAFLDVTKNNNPAAGGNGDWFITNSVGSAFPQGPGGGFVNTASVPQPTLPSN